MKKLALAMLLLGRMYPAQAQEIRTTVLPGFWDRFDWETDTTYVYDFAYAEEIALPVGAKQFSPAGRLVSEYLRIDDSTWQYQAYDTLFPAPHVMCKGRYRLSDNPADRLADTLISFDPYNYDEIRSITIRIKLLRSGHWQETDPTAVRYGRYVRGVRTGLWAEHCRQNDYEQYGILYTNGVPVADTVLNLAQSEDPNRLVNALMNNPWSLENRWRDGDKLFLGFENVENGKLMYHFQADQKCRHIHIWSCGVADQFEGKWELREGNMLWFNPQTYRLNRYESFHVEYLRDGELILSR